ncbi:MAG: APC family permease [bacterium]|nr:APC family permease [bacterium]
MGADGISSANYGPEEAFHALQGFAFLTPILALVIAAVVLLISASYIQVIQQFPPGHLIPWKLYVGLLVLLLMTIMNLRGVRESVVILTPIFMIFIITHLGLVVYGFATHIGDLPVRTVQAAEEGRQAVNLLGWGAVLSVFVSAFSKGAGTFTGIEAVSNGLLALREPRVKTGMRTMAYMAVTLAVLAALLLLNYFLFGIERVEGQTLNTVLFSRIMGDWMIGGWHVGQALIWFTIGSASLLLLVAAQTGFIDGPRVLGNMAVDSWLPHRLSHLSERLVASNGIILMGIAAGLMMIYAHGSTTILVALYAINVFITFSLSQLGMTKLWWNKRRELKGWLGHFAINGTGFIICFTMLIVMIDVKMTDGGWLTLLVTAGLVALCLYIRAHYRRVEAKVRELDDILGNLSLGESQVKVEPLKQGEPTAVLLVQRFSGQGIHLLLSTQRLFGGRFKQFIFVSVGAIDSGHFKGAEELEALQDQIETEAQKYVTLARSYGLRAEARTSCELDYVSEIERLCLNIHEEFPNSVFFAARLLFWKDTFLTRILHNETPMTLQRRLMFHGLQFVVLPVRLQ